MPSTSSSSSVMFNPANLQVSSSQNFTSTSSASHNIGLASLPSAMNSNYGSMISTVDSLNNNNILNNLNNGNNVNSLSKISPNSASHSIDMIAAAALQSLNQSHMLRAHQQLPQAHHSLARPPSNPMLMPPLHGNGSLGNNANTNASIPKLNMNLPANSDQTGYSHVLSSNQLFDRSQDFSTPFLHKISTPETMKSSSGWQDQVNTNAINLGSSRWPYSNPSHNKTLPFSNSNTTLGPAQNLSNSNSMIGPDGDINNPITSMHQRNEQQSADMNHHDIAMKSEKFSKGINNVRSGHPRWPDSASRETYPPPDDSRAIHRIPDDATINSERLGLFAYNLLNSYIPGTDRMKKVIPLDSIEDMRQTILNGEFYSKYEDIATGILSNLVIIPEFSIIDYIRRDKFNRQELEKIETVHKRLSLNDFLSLMELASQRSYPPIPKSYDLRPPQHFSLATSSPSSSAIIPQQSIQASKSSPITNKNITPMGIDKCLRSTQSPNDIFNRSQLNNGFIPRPINSCSSNLNSPTNPQAIIANQSAHLNTHKQSNTNQRNQLATNIRHSFHSPLPQIPPVTNQLKSSPISNSAFNKQSIYSSPLGQPRQPPAAHQSSTAKSTVLPTVHNLSQNSISGVGSNPISAHMSSKTPQIPNRLVGLEILQPKTCPDVHQTYPNDDNSTKNFQPNQITQSVRHDIDHVNSLQAQTPTSIKQEFMNRDNILMKRAGPMSSNSLDSHSLTDLNNIMSQTEPRMRSRSPMNQKVQVPSNIHQTNLNNGSVFRSTSTPNYTMPTSMSSQSFVNSDYQRHNDLMKLNEPWSASQSANLSSVGANIDKYGAYLNMPPQNQNLHPIAAHRMSSHTISAPNTLDASSYGQNQKVGSIHVIPSPLVHSSESLTLDMNNINDQEKKMNPPSHQRISPKQAHQRSIITGAASTGAKKNKKIKLSPTTGYSAEDSLSIHSKEPTADSHQTDTMADVGSLSATPQTIEENHNSVIVACGEPMFTVAKSQLDQPISDSNKINTTNGHKCEIQSQSGVGPLAPPSINDCTAATNSSSKNEMLRCPNNTEASLCADACKVAACDQPNAISESEEIPLTDSITTKNSALGDNATCNPLKTPKIVETSKAPDLKVEPNSDGPKSSSSLAPINNNNETSKYQKLYTKKAWLKNYDQEEEDQARAKSTMGLKKEIVNADSNANNEVKELKSNEFMKTRSSKKPSLEIKKKAKNGAIKKNSRSSARVSRNGGKSVPSKPDSKFLQTDPCYDIVPKIIRCLECRRVRPSNLKNDKSKSSKQSQKTDWDDFCRFYEFRKLRRNKSSQIEVAGFSDLDDVRDSDKAIWLPNLEQAPENISFEAAKYILTKVGDEFCKIVQQERGIQQSFQSKFKDRKITWKRAVNGLRELCDVCSTTLFNCHYVCEKCGFVVCIDCHKSREESQSHANDTDKLLPINREEDEKIPGENSAISPSKSGFSVDSNDAAQPETGDQSIPVKKSKKDSSGWIFCAKNEEHDPDRLIMTQIIASDCMEIVWNLLHDIRSKFDLGNCECLGDKDSDVPMIENQDCEESDENILILSHASHRDNLDLFRDHWNRGKPVVIRDIHKNMNIDMWLPSFFSKEFGDYRSDLVDCRNGDIHRHSMKKYWDGFELVGPSSKKKHKDESNPTPPVATVNNEDCSNGPNYYSGSALWRLKDWPPGQDFNEILPSHYDDFMNNLPLSEYTTRTGKLNLACRLPKEMLKPDLGPKMYSAYGTYKFPERGTTNLHLDISDAVNVMIYVSGATSFMSGSEEIREIYNRTTEECHVNPDMKKQINENNLVPGALWHIFKPSDAHKLREFLNKISDERNIPTEKRTDPIHDQTWYLDQTLLDRLLKEYGVKPFSILQCMGDAILIPAGAPHQVKNVFNCIKVANDFVSPENVRFCLQLTNEFRGLPETHINQEDKLQIKNILYHSVKESLQLLKMTDLGKVSENSND